MALEEYRRKRDFGKTPEPPPGAIKARKDELSYLVQKHDATRLHYDLRLELNGILLSWAVTKGPSLDPSEKRLAVRTEDHPLSYGTFEGTIPKGQYGGGTVMLWDEGTWEPKGDPRAGLQKGHLSFTLHGERLKGEWDLVRMRGEARKENWLLIKAKDAEARENGGATDFLDDLAYSVTSRRSMDAIAAGEKPATRRKPAKADKAGKTEKTATLAKNIAAAQKKIALTGKLEALAVDKPLLDRAAMSGAGAGEFHTIHWVKPVLLCEVTFTEWTEDGHIRHPSFQGLREDKKATEVKMEKPQAVRIVPKTSTLRLPASKGLVLEGITITHPERVISETGQVTKGELAEYHAAVAPYMLPRLLRHPLSLLRCPSGIGNQCFYQRNPGKGLGADVKPFKFKHKGKNYQYLYIEDAKGLLEIIQMGAIEIHPWGATVDNIDHPDRLIFDLDPAPDVPFEGVKLAAQDLRKRLKRKGLECMLKCTGGKGLHVTVPLVEKDNWDSVKTFAAGVAHEMVAALPSAYVATMTKAKRNGKIFIDFFRNDYTATAIADYAVRARPGAPVALLLSWNELDDLESGSQFTMKDVLARLKRKEPALPPPQRLPRP